MFLDLGTRLLGARLCRSLSLFFFVSLVDIFSFQFAWALRCEAIFKNSLKDSNSSSIWLSSGKEFNPEFIRSLRVAIADYKKFEYIYGGYIDVQMTIRAFDSSLRKLKNPTLVNYLKAVFLASDRLTRQYIFDSLVQIRPIDEKTMNPVLMGFSNYREPNIQEAIKTIKGVLAKSALQLQEEAYFQYTSNGVGKRPELHDQSIAKRVAVLFVQRKNFNLLDSDVRYAGLFLGRYPKKDGLVDNTLQSLLSSGAALASRSNKNQIGVQQIVNWEINYAILELEILGRNIKGLSRLDLDLAYTARILATNKPTRQTQRFLSYVLKFHEDFGLENAPLLFDLLNDFHKRFPDLLPEKI